MKYKIKPGTLVQCMCGSSCPYLTITFITTGNNLFDLIHVISLYKIKYNNDTSLYYYTPQGEYVADEFLLHNIKIKPLIKLFNL